jgi:hypothetical protein
VRTKIAIIINTYADVLITEIIFINNSLLLILKKILLITASKTNETYKGKNILAVDLISYFSNFPNI